MVETNTAGPNSSVKRGPRVLVPLCAAVLCAGAWVALGGRLTSLFHMEKTSAVVIVLAGIPLSLIVGALLGRELCVLCSQRATETRRSSARRRMAVAGLLGLVAGIVAAWPAARSHQTWTQKQAARLAYIESLENAGARVIVLRSSGDPLMPAAIAEVSFSNVVVTSGTVAVLNQPTPFSSKSDVPRLMFWQCTFVPDDLDAVGVWGDRPWEPEIGSQE